MAEWTLLGQSLFQRLSEETLMSLISVIIMAISQVGSEPPRTDLDALQGTWTMVAMETEGHDVDTEDFKDRTASYEGNRLTLREGDRIRRRGIITLNPDQKPRAVNTWDLDGPYEDQTVPGIYVLQGDTLKLCFARPGQERPKEFTTKSGTGFLVCTYKKLKR
jgi:uncharacterized protein (TIGR03067 family)